MAPSRKRRGPARRKPASALPAAKPGEALNDVSRALVGREDGARQRERDRKPHEASVEDPLRDWPETDEE